MGNRKTIKTIVSALLCVMMLDLTGCANRGGTEAGQSGTAETLRQFTSEEAGISDFSVRLLKASLEEGNNVLISPLSVICALAMTANGAEGETREQMEKVLGMEIGELDRYLSSYVAGLPQGEKYKLSLANSVWLRDSFRVRQSFTDTVSSNFKAELFSAPFDDGTLKQINDWVNEKTDGMIPSILDEVDPTSMMYLINALSFDAQWESVYKEDQIRERIFTREDGTERKVDFMSDFQNSGAYLEDEKATGFIRYYAGREYAFAALLPREGVSVEEYVSGMDGEALNALLSDPQYCRLSTCIPEFETGYSREMSELLKEMGMPRAFDPVNAEFGGIEEESDSLYIGTVIHKTFIKVSERGTSAGAATIVDMRVTSTRPDPEDLEPPKEVCLDRPFVYMLIDCETNTPFFIGTMMDPVQS